MHLLETRKTNAELEQVKKQLEKKNKDLEESKLKLEKNELQLRTMSEGTDILITVVDAENDPTFLTKSWSALTGKPVEELLLFGLTDLLHADNKQKYLDVYLEAFESRLPYSVEFRMLNAYGNYTWLLSNGSPQIAEDGGFSGYITSTIDISERRNAEHELATTTKRLELALEAGKLGTYEMNLQSGSMKTSARYNRNFGLDPLLRTNFSAQVSMVIPEDRAIVHGALANAIKNKVFYDAEYRVKLATGDVRWIHSLGIPVYNDHGDAVQVSGMSIDITQQKTFTSELERQVRERTTELNSKNLDLETSNKDLESFAFIASHDLQEPLTKIQMFASRIVDDESSSLSEKGQDHLRQVQSAAGRMKHLIEDLLEYSRTTTSERIYEHMDLSKIVEALREDLKEELQEKNATLELIDSCKLNIITFQFRQLLENIVSNSIKFCNPDRNLKIAINCRLEEGMDINNEKASDKKTYQHISISDNGIGFSEEHKETMFNLFHRIPGKSGFAGHGIGLAIVKKIVENHNGFISANSVVGEGAAFDVYIPQS